MKLGLQLVLKDEYVALLDDLTDEDDCWYDHHGFCQAHGWFETDPRCPHARAKEMSAAFRATSPPSES